MAPTMLNNLVIWSNMSKIILTALSCNCRSMVDLEMVFHHVILLGQGDALLVFLHHLFCLQARNVESTFTYIWFTSASMTVGVTLCLRSLADYMTIYIMNILNGVN